MLRNKTSSSMQKTYDECYLICSTAVYFEGQNNEAEALRSWRSALDQISYHNAYRVPTNYIPKNETEKALQESLRNLEAQCKERVDLLEALKKSRKESGRSKKNGDSSSSSSSKSRPPPLPPKLVDSGPSTSTAGWMGDGTVPPVTQLPPAAPALPLRPVLTTMSPDSPPSRSQSAVQLNPTAPAPARPPSSSSGLSMPAKKTSRTPSPEKKGGHVMLTTLRGHKDAKGRPTKPPRPQGGRKANPPPASSKAAGLAWDTSPKPGSQKIMPVLSGRSDNAAPQDALQRETTQTSSGGDYRDEAYLDEAPKIPDSSRSQRPRTPPDLLGADIPLGPRSFEFAQRTSAKHYQNGELPSNARIHPDLIQLDAPVPPPHAAKQEPESSRNSSQPLATKSPIEYPSYRTEFPPTAPSAKAKAEFIARVNRPEDSSETQSRSFRPRPPPPPPTSSKTLASKGLARRPVPNSASPRIRKDADSARFDTSESNDGNTSSGVEIAGKKRKTPRKPRNEPIPVDPALSSPPDSLDEGSPVTNSSSRGWDNRLKHVQKHPPKGIDEQAAKQIFNEIVVKGDEVHWDDVAGLDAAKTALKEAVVYPFLRPDLFMGLREPARGMLLFGPPGTGKTMLARAVATESRSTFFAISASSLTSKWLGDSEKLVRALFSLAKALAPSIIFVDEIDSLLSSRGGSSEHESTRRIKTEFLIQWSDLQRAAAGRQQSDKEKAEGDASRVLVLAATNTPWAIDEAARRRFVRRQYIPLPEAPVRAEQIRTLLGHQKHTLNKKDIAVLVELTDGFSGSDITALAKDAAMGPLRSLGEALLYTPPDEIRPINFSDFESSLITIRPSVSKQGLQEFEDWAREFGERGG